MELYNQYLERLRHFVSQELTNWHKAEATETASASAATTNNHVVKNEPGQNHKGQDQTNNSTTKNNTNTTTTTTSSSSLSISNQDSADKNHTKNNSEKFLWDVEIDLILTLQLQCLKIAFELVSLRLLCDCVRW